MSRNWLAGVAPKQVATKQEFPKFASVTPALDLFVEKIANAKVLGTTLAYKDPTLEKTAIMGALLNMARPVAGAMMRSPTKALGIGGGVLGGAMGAIKDPGVDPATGQQKSRLTGAIAGAAMGGLAGGAVGKYSQTARTAVQGQGRNLSKAIRTNPGAIASKADPRSMMTQMGDHIAGKAPAAPVAPSPPGSPPMPKVAAASPQTLTKILALGGAGLGTIGGALRNPGVDKKTGKKVSRVRNALIGGAAGGIAGAGTGLLMGDLSKDLARFEDRKRLVIEHGRLNPTLVENWHRVFGPGGPKLDGRKGPLLKNASLPIPGIAKAVTTKPLQALGNKSLANAGKAIAGAEQSAVKQVARPGIAPAAPNAPALQHPSQRALNIEDPHAGFGSENAGSITNRRGMAPLPARPQDLEAMKSGIAPAQANAPVLSPKVPANSQGIAPAAANSPPLANPKHWNGVENEWGVQGHTGENPFMGTEATVARPGAITPQNASLGVAPTMMAPGSVVAPRRSGTQAYRATA